MRAFESAEREKRRKEIMKLITTIVAGCFLLSIYATAQPNGKGIGFGPNNNPARVTPKPTPPGHHYGWQKGKHNPHRM
jgi:hypothetical protein